MDVQAVSSKFRLSEKKYLISRIACSVFIVAWLVYLPGRTITATLITIGAILLFGLQFVFQFKMLNWFLGISMLIVSIYMSFAVLSEFSEFETVSRSAWQLLLFGWGMCFTGVVLSVLMLKNFFSNIIG